MYAHALPRLFFGAASFCLKHDRASLTAVIVSVTTKVSCSRMKADPSVKCILAYHHVQSMQFVMRGRTF